MQCLGDCFSSCLPFAVFVRSAGVLNPLEKHQQTLDWVIGLLPQFPLVLRTIERGVVRGGVVSNTVSHELEEVGNSVFNYVCACLARGLEHCQNIVAVHACAGDAERDGTRDHPVRDVLVF